MLTCTTCLLPFLPPSALSCTFAERSTINAFFVCLLLCGRMGIVVWCVVLWLLCQLLATGNPPLRLRYSVWSLKDLSCEPPKLSKEAVVPKTLSSSSLLA